MQPKRKLPRFAVFHPDYLGDESFDVDAIDHEDAARSYAHDFDTDGDCMLRNGGTEDVDVVNLETQVHKMVRIGAYMDVVYTASEIIPKPQVPA